MGLEPVTSIRQPLPLSASADQAFAPRGGKDYIDGDEHKLQGVRIYTLFTYLNDGKSARTRTLVTDRRFML